MTCVYTKKGSNKVKNKIEKFIRWFDSPQFFSVIWFWHFLRRIFIDLCVHMSWSSSASNYLSVVSCHPLLLFSSVLLLSLTAFPNTNRFLLDSSSSLLFSSLLTSPILLFSNYLVVLVSLLMERCWSPPQGSTDRCPWKREKKRKEETKFWLMPNMRRKKVFVLIFLFDPNSAFQRSV